VIPRHSSQSQGGDWLDGGTLDTGGNSRRDFSASEDAACAQGKLVHVFVDQASQSSVAIPEPVRKALEQLVVN
jgi:hypothetical protein